MANQEKTIDPRILELLGLQDVSDLDYGEYKTLLKEAMVKNHPDRGGNLDDFKLLSIERDKVKNEDDKGKVKGKKEGAKSFVSRLALPGGGVKPVPDIKPSENLLEPPDEEEKEDNVIVKGLKSVLDSLKGIADLLSDQFKFDKDAHAAAVKRQKDQDKKDREAALEAKKKSEDQKKSLNIGFKAPQPLTNIFDAFKKFFGNILAGGVVVGLLDWLSKNEGKIDEFSKWLQDNVEGILIGLAALAVLPIALTLFNLGAALVSGIGLLKPALAFLFSPWGLLALAAGVVGYFGWKFVENQWTGGQAFTEAHQKLDKESEAKLKKLGVNLAGQMVDEEGPVDARISAIPIKSGEFKGYQRLAKPGEPAIKTVPTIWTRNADNTDFISTKEQRDAHKEYENQKNQIRGLHEWMDRKIEGEISDIRSQREELWNTLQENTPDFWGEGDGPVDLEKRRAKTAQFERETKKLIEAQKQRVRAEFAAKLENINSGEGLNPKDTNTLNMLKNVDGDKNRDIKINKNLNSSSEAPGPSTRKINVSTLPIPAKDSSGSSSSDSVANQTEIAYVRPEDPNNTSRDAIEGIFNLTGVG